MLKELGRPVLSTSLPVEDMEIMMDPEEIHEKFGSQVDIVIDGGMGGAIPSTIVNCTVYPPEVIREGAGEIE